MSLNDNNARVLDTSDITSITVTSPCSVISGSLVQDAASHTTTSATPRQNSATRTRSFCIFRQSKSRDLWSGEQQRARDDSSLICLSKRATYYDAGDVTTKATTENAKSHLQKLKKRFTIDVIDRKNLPISFCKRDNDVTIPIPLPKISATPTTESGRNKEGLERHESHSSGWSVSTIGLEQGACRICFTGAHPYEVTMRVCVCCTNVHPSCLIKWLQVAKLDHCEVCGHKFSIIKKVKPVSKWRMPRIETSRCHSNGLVVICVLYSILYIWGMVAAVDSFMNSIKHGRNIETSGVLALIVIGTIVFLATLLKTIEEFLKICQRCKMLNQTVHIHINGKYWRFQPESMPGQRLV